MCLNENKHRLHKIYFLNKLILNEQKDIKWWCWLFLLKKDGCDYVRTLHGQQHVSWFPQRMMLWALLVRGSGDRWTVTTAHVMTRTVLVWFTWPYAVADRRRAGHCFRRSPWKVPINGKEVLIILYVSNDGVRWRLFYYSDCSLIGDGCCSDSYQVPTRRCVRLLK